jgi:hypothetical protein
MKTTYLLGAGASRGAVPIVQEIPGELKKFREIFIQKRSEKDEPIPDLRKTIKEIEEDFIAGLDLFLKEIPRHASIDTYAKKLRITGQSEIYNQLKAVFSAFLIYTQLAKEVDSRYDSFFASILDTGPGEFVSDLIILTWNYDFQIEKAYSAFSLTDSLSVNQAMLNVNFASQDERFSQTRHMSVFKLNGTAGFYDSRDKSHHFITDKFTFENSRKFFYDVIGIYGRLRFENNSIRSSLTFAWDGHSGYYDKVAEKIKGTEVLVIIGYSFPFFNRLIDRQMIHSMAPTLNHVFVQDPNPENVLDSLTSIWPTNHQRQPKVIRSKEQFYLPPLL